MNLAIFAQEKVDLSHLYIDRTKLKSNANKYSWVWKKATEKSRYRLFAKITTLLDEAAFVPGRGRRKTIRQRRYERLKAYTRTLEEYREKLTICGDERNSYARSDHSSTFMRMKKDYMGNDQLLPAYNMQIGVADEYIAVVDVNHYRSDMDCFVPLMEKFHDLYGFYPEYPVADAGYGSYNNYLYCEAQGIKKYMKFTMFDKESKDRKYRENPYRSENFQIDPDGVMRCPNGKAFHFCYARKYTIHPQALNRHHPAKKQDYYMHNYMHCETTVLHVCLRLHLLKRTAQPPGYSNGYAGSTANSFSSS